MSFAAAVGALVRGSYVQSRAARPQFRRKAQQRERGGKEGEKGGKGKRKKKWPRPH